MSKFILKSALIGALLSSSPAMASTFVNVGDSAYIVFNGTQPGTSANLLLTLTGENSLSNTFTFSYALQNTSDAALNPSVRIPGFGFNDDTGLSGTGTATGLFDSVSFGSNFPNSLGKRDICVDTKNCGGSNEGATVEMGKVTGNLFLDYQGSGLTQITLDNFAVRYISTGPDGEGSGTGVGIVSPVPEPATWMMMLLGFAGVGFSMRRRANTTTSVQFA